jgi:mono/diheme cytochrome c family protein
VRITVVTVLAVVVAVAAGCGAVGRITQGNPEVGKTLFQSKCAACHTLANAGTTGTIGPNLDQAFLPVKQQGFHLSTIANVVRGQISIPDSNPSTGLPGMPANLVSGQQASDVSVYVAICAGVPHCDVKNTSVSVAND